MIMVAFKLYIVPSYTCLDSQNILAGPVGLVQSSTLDHPRIAHRLYSIIPHHHTINRQSYTSKQGKVIRTVHQQQENQVEKYFRTHLRTATITQTRRSRKTKLK